MEMLSFTVWGPVVGKGRPRFTRSGHCYTPTATKDAEARIRAEAILELEGKESPFGPGEPLEVTVIATMPEPKKGAVEKFPVKRPDIDNIVKLVLDALQPDIIPDDKQVSALHAYKQWAEDPELQNITVIITRKE